MKKFTGSKGSELCKLLKDEISKHMYSAERKPEPISCEQGHFAMIMSALTVYEREVSYGSYI